MFHSLANFLLAHAAVTAVVLILSVLWFSSSARSGARALARMLARLLLVAAVVALAYDGTRTLSGHAGLVTTSLLEYWSALSPASLDAVKTAAYVRLGQAAWQQVALPVLGLPAWLTACVLAALLVWLGRRPREVRIFVN